MQDLSRKPWLTEAPSVAPLMTADLADNYPDAQVAELAFKDFGGVAVFQGQVVTLKVFEDNSAVRRMLTQPGEGRVLVIDGGGSLRCALLGGNLAQLGVDNGWHGVVVNGCIRDSHEIRVLPIGVKALATSPRKSAKALHLGHRHGKVRFAGVHFRDGQWLYADADGIVVSELALHPNG